MHSYKLKCSLSIFRMYQTISYFLLNTMMSLNIVTQQFGFFTATKVWEILESSQNRETKCTDLPKRVQRLCEEINMETSKCNCDITLRFNQISYAIHCTSKYLFVSYEDKNLSTFRMLENRIES